MVDKLPSSKLYKILASSHKLNVVVDDNDDENERGCLSTIKDKHNRHQRAYKHKIQYYYMYILYMRICI